METERNTHETGRNGTAITAKLNNHGSPSDFCFWQISIKELHFEFLLHSAFVLTSSHTTCSKPTQLILFGLASRTWKLGVTPGSETKRNIDGFVSSTWYLHILMHLWHFNCFLPPACVLPKRGKTLIFPLARSTPDPVRSDLCYTNLDANQWSRLRYWVWSPTVFLPLVTGCCVLVTGFLRWP